MIGDGADHLPARWGQAGTQLHVDRDGLDQEPEGVVLDLIPGGVAYPHRRRSPPPGDTGHHPLLGNGTAPHVGNWSRRHAVPTDSVDDEGQVALGQVTPADQCRHRHGQGGVP